MFHDCPERVIALAVLASLVAGTTGASDGFNGDAGPFTLTWGPSGPSEREARDPA